jgi:hypothetical protein
VEVIRGFPTTAFTNSALMTIHTDHLSLQLGNHYVWKFSAFRFMFIAAIVSEYSSDSTSSVSSVPLQFPPLTLHKIDFNYPILSFFKGDFAVSWLRNTPTFRIWHR